MWEEITEIKINVFLQAFVQVSVTHVKWQHPAYLLVLMVARDIHEVFYVNVIVACVITCFTHGHTLGQEAPGCLLDFLVSFKHYLI